MSYEPDDGPLTDEQMDRIRELSPDMPDEAMTDNLFDKAAAWAAANPVTEKPLSSVGKLASEIPRIVREVFGPQGSKPWPTLNTQPLTIELASELRNKSQGDLYVVGTGLADYIRHTNSEEYFAEHGESLLAPWADIHQSKSGREAGYVGMLLGLEIYTHPDLSQNVFICIKQGSKPQAVVGYVQL